jgi:hypothetical protein
LTKANKAIAATRARPAPTAPAVRRASRRGAQALRRRGNNQAIGKSATWARAMSFAVHP